MQGTHALFLSVMSSCSNFCDLKSVFFSFRANNKIRGKKDRYKDKVVCSHCESTGLSSEKCGLVRKNLQIHTERKHPGLTVKFRIPNVTSISSIFKAKSTEDSNEPELKKVKLVQDPSEVIEGSYPIILKAVILLHSNHLLTTLVVIIYL